MKRNTRVARTRAAGSKKRASPQRGPRARIDQWIRGYLRAWRSDDPRAVGKIFAANALYSTGPFDKPWRGRKKIVAEWIARGDSKIVFGFRYKIIVAADGMGMIDGRTTYAPSRGLARRVYGNLWLIRLNGRGEAVEFREWFMPRR
jgi:hypothetical protein